MSLLGTSAVELNGEVTVCGVCVLSSLPPLQVLPMPSPPSLLGFRAVPMATFRSAQILYDVA